MMGKRIASFKNLAKKAKSFKNEEGSSEYVLIGEGATLLRRRSLQGTFAVYVGEERVKQLVPTSYLKHPVQDAP
ncbi:unnamed protein product [Brassica napus]|nr:unnamed protein product [Brassica napus]